MTEQQEGRLLERVEHIATTVGRIDTTINGNGKEGLKTTVQRHDGTLKGMTKFLWILATTVIGVVGALLLTLL